MKKRKKLLGIFMSGVVLLTGGVLPQKNAATAEGATDYGISSPRIENGVTTWDKIKFGSYYQDFEVQPAEPIKWRVLSVDGDDAFLLADKILDVKPYNEELDGVTWETCTLRKWLNEDFYNEAFDDEEKKAVMETTVVNENNPSYDTEGGNDTNDNVYLLSITEACNADYGFDTVFREESKTREVKNTDYAKENDAWTNESSWWLRSPGEYSAYASYVDYDGGGDCDGPYKHHSNNGVRPALHINLLSSKVTYAGRVDSEGNVTISDGEISNPVVENEVTTWDCVYFGSYRQEFSVKQDIEWRVLSVDGDDAFLLADKILDAKKYNEEFEDTKLTWETCTLRKWLNEDFYNEAFTDEEKEAVRETTVVNGNNQEYGTKGGENTKDKVYLLSIAEASDSSYGFETEFDKDSKTREVKNTVYAKVNGVRIEDGSVFARDIYWWLRSPGDHPGRASSVEQGGYGKYLGGYVTLDNYGVRPALHINLSSSSWSLAGQVTTVWNSDDTPTASPEPTKAPTPTDEPTATPEPTKAPTPTDEPTATPEPTKAPTPTDEPTATPEPTKAPTPTDEPTTTPEPTKAPTPTDEPTATPEPTKAPTPTDGPTATPEPTKTPTPTDKPTASPGPEPTTTPTVTAQPTPPSVETPNPVQTAAPLLKQLKLSSVKCAKNAKKITGKVSVSKAAVKIKVGKKAYKKAAVKGKKFTLKLKYKLKKKTKVIIKAEKKGYKSVVKAYTVK